MQWLPPAGGRQARYRLLDVLLKVGGDAADGLARTRRYPPMPASALMIVLTPLHTRDALEAVAAWRSRGRSVVVVVIDAVELLGPAGSESERLGRRLWTLERQRRVDELRALGVPVVVLPPTGPITAAVAALGRVRTPPRSTRSPPVRTPIRTVLMVATVVLVAGVALVAAALNPPGTRAWLIVCVIVAAAMAVQAVTSEPRDLIPALLFALCRWWAWSPRERRPGWARPSPASSCWPRSSAP